MVLRSIAVTRSISLWLSLRSRSVRRVVCKCGFKAFPPTPPPVRGAKVTPCPVPTAAAGRTRQPVTTLRSGGGIWVATGGGVWVAVGEGDGLLGITFVVAPALKLLVDPHRLPNWRVGKTVPQRLWASP